MPSEKMFASSFSRSFANSVDGKSVGRSTGVAPLVSLSVARQEAIEHDPTLNIDSPKQWKVCQALARDEMEFVLRRSRAGGESKGIRSDSRSRPCHAGGLLHIGIASVRSHWGKDRRLEDDLGCMVCVKGDKERIVPLEKGAGCPRRIHHAFPPVLAKGTTSPLLFLGRGARKLSRQRVWQMVRAAAVGTGRKAQSAPCCVTAAPPTWWRTAPTCGLCRPF